MNSLNEQIERQFIFGFECFKEFINHLTANISDTNSSISCNNWGIYRNTIVKKTYSIYNFNTNGLKLLFAPSRKTYAAELQKIKNAFKSSSNVNCISNETLHNLFLSSILYKSEKSNNSPSGLIFNVFHSPQSLEIFFSILAELKLVATKGRFTKTSSFIDCSSLNAENTVVEFKDLVNKYFQQLSTQIEFLSNETFDSGSWYSTCIKSILFLEAQHARVSSSLKIYHEENLRLKQENQQLKDAADTKIVTKITPIQNAVSSKQILYWS